MIKILFKSKKNSQFYILFTIVTCINKDKRKNSVLFKKIELYATYVKDQEKRVQLAKKLHRSVPYFRMRSSSQLMDHKDGDHKSTKTKVFRY